MHMWNIYNIFTMYIYTYILSLSLSCGSPSWAFDHYYRDVVPFPAVKLIALGSIVATPLGAPILTYWDACACHLSNTHTQTHTTAAPGGRETGTEWRELSQSHRTSSNPTAAWCVTSLGAPQPHTHTHFFIILCLCCFLFLFVLLFYCFTEGEVTTYAN